MFSLKGDKKTENVSFKVISPLSHTPLCGLPLKGGFVAVNYFKLAISGVAYVFFKRG